MTARIRRYLDEVRPETPCLVVDLEAIEDTYKKLEQLLPDTRIFYAMKANPAPEILSLLVGLGSSFDCASIYEIEDALAAGATADRLSFGNTIKKASHIARAYELGVRLFAFDSEAELQKLVAAAPGAAVYCRLLASNTGADWPLGKKFGCEPGMAVDLLMQAQELGLDPCGVSFHIGSQQRNTGAWDGAIATAANVFAQTEERGLQLRLLNLGGGFCATYQTDAPDAESHATAILEAVRTHFGNRPPALITEPGRSLVGDAGVLQAEVVLVARKQKEDEHRWVYLDVGKFGGLIETMDEAIKYRMQTSRDGAETGPVILAGPTCDEVDVMYQKDRPSLPVNLQCGDKVEFLSTGAYTSTYSSVAFNGLPPLRTYCI